MLVLEFSGWFQCRLATDPDPHDEPRGVSGYVHAYVGEPDLDRIIHWSPPPFQRTHAQLVGVTVSGVANNGVPVAGHPLVGASLALLGQPKFEGRNGVIADDGEEPIYPFNLQISAGGLTLQRAVAPRNEAFPYRELFAVAFEGGPAHAADIAATTGYAGGLLPVWRDRLEWLHQEMSSAKAQGEDTTALAERIAFLSNQLRSGGGAGRFFGARMRYDYLLAAPATVVDPQGVLGDIDGASSWRATFWKGGWDADTLCGFVKGSLSIPFTGDPPLTGGRGPRRP